MCSGRSAARLRCFCVHVCCACCLAEEQQISAAKTGGARKSTAAPDASEAPISATKRGPLGVDHCNGPDRVNDCMGSHANVPDVVLFQDDCDEWSGQAVPARC